MGQPHVSGRSWRADGAGRHIDDRLAKSLLGHQYWENLMGGRDPAHLTLPRLARMHTIDAWSVGGPGGDRIDTQVIRRIRFEIAYRAFKNTALRILAKRH